MGLKSFLKKIWNTSPSEIFKRLLYFFKTAQSVHLETIAIKSGQAGGIFINLPSHLKSYYGKMAEGNYEPYILESLEVTGGLRDKVIWDIGSHIGYHTLLFAKYAGDKGKVIAYEPNPENRRLLENNIALNRQLSDIIDIRSEALSNYIGNAKMLISPNTMSTSSSGSHLADVVAPYKESVYKDFKEVEVKLDTIDNIVSKGAPQPDIIKMDVEGAEYAVISGAQNTLRSQMPIMIIEIHTVEAMHRVSKLLHGLGYNMSIIDPDSPFLTRNILAIPKK